MKGHTVFSGYEDYIVTVLTEVIYKLIFKTRHTKSKVKKEK